MTYLPSFAERSVPEHAIRHIAPLIGFIVLEWAAIDNWVDILMLWSFGEAVLADERPKWYGNFKAKVDFVKKAVSAYPRL